MKIFIAFTLIFIVLYILGFIWKPAKSVFLDKIYTNQIKGFAVLTVVWAHGSDHFGIGGIQFIAGAGVAIFLICSGYGLEKSYEKNGLSGFWKKRFLRICIPMWIIEFAWECINKTLSLKNYVANALLLGGAGWYLRYLFVCYVIYYFLKTILKRTGTQRRGIVALFSVFGLFFIYECIWPWSYAIPFLRARQMLCFPMGVMLASTRDTIETKLRGKKTQIAFAIAFFIIGLLFLGLTQLETVKHLGNFFNNLLSLFTVFPLAIGILLFTKNQPWILQSRFFTFLGMISYEVFLVQSYTQQYIEASIFSAYIYIIITIVIALALHLLVNIPNYITKKKERL